MTRGRAALDGKGFGGMNGMEQMGGTPSHGGWCVNGK